MTNNRARLTVATVAVVLALTGCAAGLPTSVKSVTVTAQSTKTDAAGSIATELQRVTLTYQTESSCSGTVDVDVPKGAQVQGEMAVVSSGGVPMIIHAYCDSRDRYERNGLTAWKLDAVNELTYGHPLTELENYTGNPVTVSGQPGFRWSYTANGEWWLTQASIVGDNYQTVQVEIHLPTVATESKSLADRILDKVDVHIG